MRVIHYKNLTVYLLSVCDVRAVYTQKVKLFGNIFASPNSLGTRTLC